MWGSSNVEAASNAKAASNVNAKWGSSNAIRGSSNAKVVSNMGAAPNANAMRGSSDAKAASSAKAASNVGATRGSSNAKAASNSHSKNHTELSPAQLLCTFTRQFKKDEVTAEKGASKKNCPNGKGGSDPTKCSRCKRPFAKLPRHFKASCRFKGYVLKHADHLIMCDDCPEEIKSTMNNLKVTNPFPMKEAETMAKVEWQAEQ